MVQFNIPGQPQGKARARTLKSGRSYTPAKTVQYENLVKECYSKTNTEKWFDKEPLCVQIIAHYPVPKSTTKKDRQLIAEHKLLPTKKPDTDNIAKIVCDALNGVAYGDDAQIVRLLVTKDYTIGEPSVEVIIGKVE